MLNKNSFYVVRAWMITDLGLKSEKLVVFAIIYSLSKKGTQWCHISYSTLQLIAEWAGRTVKYIRRIIKHLVKNKLLIIGVSTNASYCKLTVNPYLIAK